MSETKYVELFIVNDHSEFIWLGSKIENNKKRMKQIANIMDSLYQPENIRIVLIGLEVWNVVDRFTITSSIKNTLTKFLDYRQNNISPLISNDNAALVSHINFFGTTIGVAPVSGMCREDKSGSVTQDTAWDHSQVAGAMTHEMGHTLGMWHDRGECGCQEKTKVRAT